MTQAQFSVDTHLFRELGELLVGRDSTALVELIKNAYDADAQLVTIHGQNLTTPSQGRITIKDDGNGMTPDQFRNGFLRVASRMKEAGERRSPHFKRRYTGAKGIGRLAAHKLASELRILSFPGDHNPEDDKTGVIAEINWTKIEELQTLDQVAGSNAMSVEDAPKLPIKHPASDLVLGKPGTTIELRRLRRKWTQADLARFFAEVQTYTPPTALIHRDEKVVPTKLLFDSARVSDVKTKASSFDIKLAGEFQGGEDYWDNVVHTAHWLIEVDANAESKEVRIAVMPTRSGQREFPKARRTIVTIGHPEPSSGLSFQARIFVREGGGGTLSQRAWLGRTSGIRVFMEGFRVLPYGEPNDDWLSLDADYNRRNKTLPLLEKLDVPAAEDENEGLLFLGNRSYFGAVFLTQDRAPELKMLINREGFVPEGGYNAIVDILRKAVYFSVRTRAAVKLESREKRSEERLESAVHKAASQSRLNLKQAVEVSVVRANTLAHEARDAAAKGDYSAASEKIAEAAREFTRASGASERLMTEGSVLRILASVGMQMASFVHEVNSLLASALAVEGAVDRILEDRSLATHIRQRIGTLRNAVGELRRSVERQAAYLTDIISPDARRRRSRQRLAERFDAARRLIDDVAEQRSITIDNTIPADVKTPPMFPAEVTAILTNLLTNAVKAAGDKGRIRATAEASDGSLKVRLENTGVAVDLEEAERWFRPFESTTVAIDPVLGQGMGMGLPITRNLLGEYGASIHFAKPSRGFATAVEITIPE